MNVVCLADHFGEFLFVYLLLALLLDLINSFFDDLHFKIKKDNELLTLSRSFSKVRYSCTFRMHIRELFSEKSCSKFC